MQFITGQHIHIVGIGGTGMSAIARILLERGFTVSGSDRSIDGVFAQALQRDGVTVYEGHDAQHITGADMVLMSSAIYDNPEIEAAKAQGIPVYKRRDVMAALMRDKQVIAIAGTHGKTTTTAMVTHLLREIGQNPSYILGGVMANTGTNAGVGTGEHFVIEADEYDNMFLGIEPDIAVLTNLEYDHPDFFTSEEMLFDSFRQFMDKLAPDGRLIVCTDSPHVVALTQHDQRRVTFSLRDAKSLHAENITVDAQGFTVFDVHAMTHKIATARLSLPGNHNISNALGAISAVIAAAPNVEPQAICDALATFKTTGRRFEVRGEVNQITVIDDYAHHPTAISAILQTAKAHYPERAVWAVWQPHTFSRTKTLLSAYIDAFTDADHVLITDIYPARENPPEGESAASIAQAISQQIAHTDVQHSGDLSATAQILLNRVQSPAVIVIMSAGDAPQIGATFLKQME